MSEKVITLVPKVWPKKEKNEPVAAIVKKLEALLADAKSGKLRAIGLTGVDLVDDPEEYVCKYSIFVSYDYDLGDPYTLEHFLLSGHDIAKRRIMDNCILPDLDSTDLPSFEEPEPDPAS